MSDAVVVAPSIAYPESAHPYAANMDLRWVYAAEKNIESLSITFSEDTKTEKDFDYIYLNDQNGTQIGQYDGTALAGKAIEIQGSAVSIRLTSNVAVQYYGFAITNIEKHISGSLTFVSLTSDNTNSQTGDLILSITALSSLTGAFFSMFTSQSSGMTS